MSLQDKVLDEMAQKREESKFAMIVKRFGSVELDGVVWVWDEEQQKPRRTK
jgi:hypothetical protein